jgi:hypothetical protein
LIVDRANLPATAKRLANYLARAGGFFERGAQVVRIVHGPEGDWVEPLNPTKVLVEAHRVCTPVAERVREALAF